MGVGGVKMAGLAVPGKRGNAKLAGLPCRLGNWHVDTWRGRGVKMTGLAVPGQRGFATLTGLSRRLGNGHVCGGLPRCLGGGGGIKN